MGLISWLGPLGWILDPISKIAHEIARMDIAKRDAETEQERIAADERIAGLTAQRDVIIATQQYFTNRLMRFLIAFPVAFILWKLFIWDKAFGWGATDPLGQDLWDILKIVVSGYFLTEVVGKFRK